MSKTIMIIGGGLLQVPAILEAKKMGLRVIVTDYNADAVGMRDADIPIVMSTKDIEGSVRIARQQHQSTPISGVLTVGTDASMTVAAVANALNLPGIKFEDAEAATNKIKMRMRFKENNVPSPSFLPVWSLKDAKKASKIIGMPLVIKPADNMGARGVRRVDNMNDLPEAFKFAKSASPSGEILVEEYMEGPELSVDALIFNEEITFTGIADRIIEHAPLFIETGHTMPSSHPDDILEQVRDVMTQGIRALGITQGAAKGDIKLTRRGPMIGELAARLSGGFMSAYTYPLHSGVNLMRAAIEIALGEEPGNLEPVRSMVAIERAIMPAPGIVKAIQGLEQALAIKGIEEIFLNVKPGDKISPVRSNVEKAGHIIATGATLAEAEKSVELCRKVLDISVLKDSEMSLESIRLAARDKLKKVCYACKVCDGRDCPSGVPGMGGVGTGASFRRNLASLNDYLVTTRLIHNVTIPDTSTTLFGMKIDIPILAAPITGMVTNMGGAMDELEYNRAVVTGCLAAGSLAFVGDGATPEKYRIGLQALAESSGAGIPIFKPRFENDEIIKRLIAAEESGALAVGMDIDAIVFKTMAMKNQAVGAKNIKNLKELIAATKLPFILKGIMNAHDAEQAVKAGASAIIVSNHGGRVLDGMAGSMDVLESIVKAVKGSITILVDGGFRSGTDIIKGLAMGADAVCIGRPLAIAAVGMGKDGVAFYLQKIRDELVQAMILTGSQTLSDIPGDILMKHTWTAPSRNVSNA